MNASPITKITSWLKFLGKNLHLVGCATLCSKSEVMLLVVLAIVVTVEEENNTYKIIVHTMNHNSILDFFFIPIRLRILSTYITFLEYNILRKEKKRLCISHLIILINSFASYSISCFNYLLSFNLKIWLFWVPYFGKSITGVTLINQIAIVF